MNYKSFARKSSVLVGIFTVLLSLSARAQWSSITSQANYQDESNWVSGTINNRIIGDVGANSRALNVSYEAGSTTIYTGAFDARKLTVGEVVSGSGIPAGATVTAINNAGQFTISAATTLAATSGVLTASGWGSYQFPAGNFVINSDGSNRTIAGDFVVLNRGNNGMYLTPNGGNWFFTNPVTNLVVDLAGAGVGQSFTFGNSGRGRLLNFSGGVLNFSVDPSTNLGSNWGQGSNVDTLTMAVTGTNISVLNKSGAGTLKLAGNQNHIWTVNNSPVTVTGGQLVMETDNYNLNGARLKGATRYDIIGPGSALVLNLTGTYAGQTLSAANLIESVPINLWSAQLGVFSNKILNDSQSVGEVNLRGGRNAITALASNDLPATTTLTFTMDRINRENNATLSLFFRTYNYASDNVRVKVTNDANLTGSLVGGAGAAGSKTVSIIPWITMTAGAGLPSPYNQSVIPGEGMAYTGVDLVTYTSAGGFRGLTADEYDNTFAAAATTGVNSNVWITANNTILNTAQTINALKLSPAITMTLNEKLTVSSGVLLRASANSSNTTINGSGTISSGDAPLYVYGHEKFTIGVTLTNSVSNGPGLILAQSSGTTILTGSNSYGGSTLVQGIASLQAAGAVTNSELRVDLGGKVFVENAGTIIQVTKLSGNGTVNLPSGLAQLNIGGPAGANGDITVNAGGILAPGDAAGQLQAGTLWLGDQVDKLVFKKDSILDFDIASATLSDMVSSLNPDATLTLSDGAIVRLNFLNSYTPTDEVSWLLTSGFDTLNLGDYLIQDQNGNALDNYTLTNVNNSLMLSYSAIPEPTTLALLLGGAALLLTLRRRR